MGHIVENTIKTGNELVQISLFARFISLFEMRDIPILEKNHSR